MQKHTPTSSHHWAIDGDGDFTLERRSTPIEQLENGIYLLTSCNKGCCNWLMRQGDAFKLPDPLYGMEEDFVHRLVRTYKHGHSFAAMFTGLKGTGKTVTCQKVANSIDQPCIIVTANSPGLVPFISRIPQPVTVFIDEFEKVFAAAEGNAHPDAALLPLLDGAMKGDQQRLYLFTSNKMEINENLIQRPGRIRYVKKFGNLPLPTIREVVTDRIVNRERLEPTVAFVSTLETITLDIVTALVDEVNIHNDDPTKYPQFFNVEQLVIAYDVWEHEKGKEFPKFLQADAKLSPDIESMEEGDTFYINRMEVGLIKTVLDDGTLIVRAFKRDEMGKAIPIPDAPAHASNEEKYETTIRKFEFKPVSRRNYGKADAWDQ